MLLETSKTTKKTPPNAWGRNNQRVCFLVCNDAVCNVFQRHFLYFLNL
jgi:hypothetical protein